MFKIGDVEINGRVICAPMAGITNQVFRKLVSKWGACHTYTEMISNVGLKHNSEKTMRFANVDQNEGSVSLQIFGGDVHDYIEAAKFYDKNSNASIIDINMGCPVRKVAIKSQAGSSLMNTPEKIGEIIKGIVAVISKPLTIKIRTGWSDGDLSFLNVAKIAEEAGVAAIAIHGRSREQMYTGKANWEYIKELKESVSIPIIGNGDITTPEEAKKMLDETGVDAIMIAREARDNPWIFKQINDYLETGKYSELPSLLEVKKYVKQYLEDMKTIKDDYKAFVETKGLSVNWFKRFENTKQIRNELVQTKTEEEFLSLLDNLQE